MPDITVIIPAYNASKYIKTAIDCLKNQTFANFECIIVDDYSVDDTHELARQLTARDKRFKILHNSQNLGQAKSRNLGLAGAKGKYILWLDADDYYDENLLKESYQRAEATDADITAFNVNVILHHENKSDDFAIISHLVPVKSTFTLKDMNGGQPSLRLAVLRNELWNKMFRKDFLLKHNLRLNEKLRRCDDLDLSIRALLLADKIAFINKCLIVYNAQLSGSNQATIDKHPRSAICALENIYQFLQKMRLVDEFYGDFVTLMMINAVYNYTILNHSVRQEFLRCFQDLIAKTNTKSSDLSHLPQGYQDFFAGKAQPFEPK